MVFLILEDLQAFAPGIDPVRAQAMIDDASAMAVLAAPCIAEDPSTLTVAQLAALKAILRGAILRWDEAGSGAMSAQTAGPFGMTVDTRQPRRGMFWPSEIQQLRDLCGGSLSSGAFSVDMVADWSTTITHSDICALNFGAVYCSCGAVLTYNLPLYENL